MESRTALRAISEEFERASVGFFVTNAAWWANRAREFEDRDDRETYEEGLAGLAQREGAPEGVCERVAASLHMLGGMVMFFDGEGAYLGASTRLLDDHRFFSRGEALTEL